MSAQFNEFVLREPRSVGPTLASGDQPLARRLAIAAIFLCFLPNLIGAIRGTTALAEIGSYSLSLKDLAVPALLLAIVSRIDIGRIGLFRVILFLILSLAFMNLLRGISGGTPFAAVFDFRNRASLLLFFAFVLTRWGSLRPGEYLNAPLTIIAVTFICLFIARLGGGPLLFVDGNSFGAVDIEYLEDRLLDAQAVICLGASAAFFLSVAAHRPPDYIQFFYRSLAVLCLIVVLLSRQRTATVAIFAGLGILLLLDSDLLGRNRMLRRILAVTLFCIVLLVVTLVASGEMLAILPESFRDSLLKRDTWYGRMEIWEGALYTYNSWGLSSRAFGRPAGESLNIVLYNNTEWIYSVHNAYIGFLIDYGFVGAGLWVTLLLAALVAAFRTRKMLPVFSYDLHPSVAASWLTMLLIFGFSYEWRDALAVFLGLALIPLIRRKDTQFVAAHGAQGPRRLSG